ncbi:MAG TPA: phosphate ABC transporter substrate-binding protein PstS [Gemmataceae bacterium]|nr:phosphate ABC transporter substrate-binding protein PstS [Gemmataceae bacterium]
MRLRNLLPAVAIVPLLAVFLLVGCNDKGGSGGPSSGPAGTAVRISGGGATFVDPIMQKWSAEYKTAKGTEIDYSKSGSSDGIKQMTEKSLDFGCSDAPMKKDQVEKAMEKGGQVVHVPLIMGAVAVVYNLPNVQNLMLSGPVIADIYLGKITKWNADPIKALNPGVELPDMKIIPVYRQEGSGTTNIFTEYLNKVSPEFADKIPASTSPTWPQIGLAQKGSDGVAAHVKQNERCIGYVEVSYAKMNAIHTALVQNSKGKFIAPDAAAVTAAGEWAINQKQTKAPYSLHELTYSLTNAEADTAYPISGISYGLLYKKQSGEKGKKLVEFFKWATSDGQKFATELHYAPLPADLSKKVADRLSQIEFAD